MTQESLRPLFWHEGLFLRPQHLQQQDRYHEERLRQYLGALIPLCWGVRSLEIRESALQNFSFEIARCEILTFDGTLIRIGIEGLPDTAHVIAQSFETNLDPSGKPLAVHLGVQRWQREDNVRRDGPADPGGAAGSGVRRYSRESSSVADLFGTGSAAADLDYLSLNARLLFGEPSTSEFESVQIAEVRRTASGQGAELSGRYIPPCLGVRSSRSLESLLRDVLNLLISRGRALGEFRRMRGGAVAELSGRNVALLVRAQTINRYIPLLSQALEIGEIPPFEVYGVLRQLVAELSTVSETISVLGAHEGQDDPLPPYSHIDIGTCFETAKRRIVEVLELPVSTVPQIRLEWDEKDGYFSAVVDRYLLDGDSRYYLLFRIPASAPNRHAIEERLESILTEEGKVASKKHMKSLIAQAAPGLRVLELRAVPDALSMMAGYRYFELSDAADPESVRWKEVKESASLAVYVWRDRLPTDTEILLVVVSR